VGIVFKVLRSPKFDMWQRPRYSGACGTKHEIPDTSYRYANMCIFLAHPEPGVRHASIGIEEKLANRLMHKLNYPIPCTVVSLEGLKSQGKLWRYHDMA